MSTEVAVQTIGTDVLPTSGDPSEWSPKEAALMSAAGLVKKQGQNYVYVPRPDAEAFLYQCHRTGLDPIARQIYLVERGGKYTIQISIDGARLTAQRSGEYRGQTAAQWTDGTKAPRPLRRGDGSLEFDGNGHVIMVDDYVWTDVWLQNSDPLAARVGVYREGFAEPVFAVANFAAYSAGGNMWKKMPALMIAKCAEMLALRKAFPMELSGLYSTEEMEQAGGTELGEAAAKPATKPRGRAATAKPAAAVAAPSAPPAAPEAAQEAAAAPAADVPMATEQPAAESDQISGHPTEEPRNTPEDQDAVIRAAYLKKAANIRQLDGEEGLRALFKQGRNAKTPSGGPVLGIRDENGEALGDTLLAIASNLPEIAADAATGEVVYEGDGSPA